MHGNISNLTNNHRLPSARPTDSAMRDISVRTPPAVPASGDPRLKGIEDRLRTDFMSQGSLTKNDVEAYRSEFNKVFGEKTTGQLFASIDARRQGGRSIKPKDIKAALDDATGQRKTTHSTMTKMENARKKIVDLNNDLKKKERYLNRLKGEYNYGPVGRRDELKNKIEPEQDKVNNIKTEISNLKEKIDKYDHMLKALATPPKISEDKQALLFEIDRLELSLASAKREFDKSLGMVNQLGLTSAKREFDKSLVDGELSNNSSIKYEEEFGKPSSKYEINESSEEEEESFSDYETEEAPAERKRDEEQFERKNHSSLRSEDLGEGWLSLEAETFSRKDEIATELAGLTVIAEGAIEARGDYHHLDVHHAQERLAKAREDLDQARIELSIARTKLQQYDSLPPTVQHRAELEALGHDPRLRKTLTHRAPEQTAFTLAESRRAKWLGKDAGKTALAKIGGLVMAPATLPVSAAKAISSENVQRRMKAAQTLLGDYPFARRIAASLEGTHEQMAASAGIDFAMTFATVGPGLMGVSPGGFVGGASSAAVSHATKGAHLAIGTATGDVADMMVGEGASRTLGKKLESLGEEEEAESEGSIPRLPMDTDRGQVFVDLSDPEAVKGLLEYLGPGQDDAILQGSDLSMRQAELRRLDYRETYFGVTPKQHFGRHKFPTDPLIADKHKELQNELDKTKPGGIAKNMPPLVLLYAALDWFHA